MAQHVVILGNGIAGITAARHIRKRSAETRITVVSGETDHFFSRTALMYIYMGHMKYEHTKPYEDSFWAKNRIELRRGWVARVDTAGKALVFDDGSTLAYDSLVLATGSASNKFGWPGQDLPGVQGLYSFQDLESMEANTKGIERGVVIGGGLIGIETAEMLHSRDIPVTFLVREPSWMANVFPAEESELINREIRQNGIDLRLGAELDRIEAGPDGRAAAVVTKDGETVPCGFVALTVGVHPNIGFLKESEIETDRGILVDDHLRTNIPDVYAAGDCVQLREAAPGRRPIEAVWYTGRAMGQTLARTLTGEPTPYLQGRWFNSAKFFDLEWQIYGEAPAKLPEGVATLCWQHAEKPLLIRINYRESDQVVTGFQVMGVRYRHDACHRWLEDGRTLRYVLENLGAANFDPEFYREYESEVVALYNRKFPEAPVQLKRRRGLAGWIRSLRAS